MNVKNLSEYIKNGGIDARLGEIYQKDSINRQRERYISALSEFGKRFGYESEVSIFSVPGRSELSGNHTDHNRGRVIAASVDLDIVAVVAKREDSVIRVKSEGFDEDTVDLSEYTAPRPENFGTSASIIAGVAAGFLKNGYRVGGFDAYTTSDVPEGSGLSSSAAFENMIGTVLAHTYNGGNPDATEIAKISQYAENEFFGKPCGLMDQVASATGGIVAIDFKDANAPQIEKISFDLTARGYALCIIKTGGSHADLTEDYAAIPKEMKSVAKALGHEVLAEASEEELLSALPTLRETLSDRAILRAIHFFEENKRVTAKKAALESGDLDKFLSLVKASGLSSFCYLQNVYSPKAYTEQKVSLALCLSELYLGDKPGAWRVHGGGFAGTIQAFLPTKEVAGFKEFIDGALGVGATTVLSIRNHGALKII